MNMYQYVPTNIYPEQKHLRKDHPYESLSSKQSLVQKSLTKKKQRHIAHWKSWDAPKKKKIIDDIETPEPENLI